MKPKTNRTIQSGFLLTLLAIGGLLMLLPFWVMLCISLTDNGTVLNAQSPLLWPKWPLHLENYQLLAEQIPLGRYFLNSLFVSFVTTVGHVLVAAMAGYAFARLPLPARNSLFFGVLITMMIPPQVNIVPLFFLMKTFHWVDTYWALIVPGLFGAFGVFLCRQWFKSLPRDLEDAARLDGCTPWQTFWQVMLPISLPVLAVLAIFVFIGSWNSFLWPLIITQSDHVRTLPLGLAVLKESSRDVVNWPLLMAAATVSVLPIVLIYSIAQKQFIAGVLSGSVKE
jgi:multiple sugar transport system permease protein